MVTLHSHSTGCHHAIACRLERQSVYVNRWGYRDAGGLRGGITVRSGKEVRTIISSSVSCKCGVLKTLAGRVEGLCAQALQRLSQQEPLHPCLHLSPVSSAPACCCMPAIASAACMSIWSQCEVLPELASVEVAQPPRNGATASARAIMTRNHCCVCVCIVYKGSPVLLPESRP